MGAFDNVVLGFAAVRIAGEAALLAERAEVLAAGEELMHMDWWPVSKTMLSRGESKIRCTAMVSSTTPRFGPRWPPVWETLPIRNSLTSAASCSSCASDNLLRSCGLRMVSKIPNGPSLRVVDMPFNSNASEPGGMPETGKPRSVGDGPGLSGGAAGRR